RGVGGDSRKLHRHADEAGTAVHPTVECGAGTEPGQEYGDGDRLSRFGWLSSSARPPYQQCAAGAGLDSATATVHEDQLCPGYGSAAKYSGREYDVRGEHDQPAGEFGAELVRRWICIRAAQSESG